MGIVIQFYIPRRFQKKYKWIPPEGRGQVIEFRLLPRKYA